MHKKLKILFIHLLILFSMDIAMSQSNDFVKDIIPPSPDAASLGKYGEHNVSLYTGTPDITIPLFEIKSGEVNIPISLSYHASGNRVDDVASWVGLGWSLNAGGVITRSVKGGYNDEYLGSYVSGPDGDYDQGNTIWHVGLFNKSEYMHKNEPPTVLNGRLDAEPDIFYYNMPEGVGKFFFNENKQLFKVPYTSLDINHKWGNATYGIKTRETFKEFNLISTSGIKYKFDIHEGSLNTNHCYTGVMGVLIGIRQYVSSWYLSEIKDSKGNIQMMFEYDSIPRIDIDNYHTYNYGISDPSSCNCNNSSSEKCKSTQSVMSAKKIRKITFTNGYILFHANHNRQDLTNDKALTKIELFNNDDVLQKRYILSYDYFVSPGCSNSECKRLKLVSVVEENKDNEQKPPYLFKYNETQLPARHSTYQDYMGFYNSNVTDLKPRIYVYPSLDQDMFSIFETPPSSYTGQTYVLSGSDRKCNPDDILAGTIEKITYPTGGYTEFNFGPHEFYYFGNIQQGGGVRINSKLTHDGVDSNNDQVTNYTYSGGAIVSIPLYGYLCDDEFAAASNSYNDLWSFYDTYTIRKSYSQGVLGSIDGPNIGYEEVKVEQVGNGYIISKYTSQRSHPDIDPVITHTDRFYCSNRWSTDPARVKQTSKYPFTPGTSQSSQRGKLIEIEYYNKDGQIVKRLTNEYDLISKGEQNITVETYYIGGGRHDPDISFKSIYDIRSDATVLSRSTEDIFPIPGNESTSISIINEMIYDENYLLLTDKRTFDSEGSQFKTLIKYPIDFPGNDIIAYMKNRNMLNYPIETVKYKNNKVIQSSITSYKCIDCNDSDGFLEGGMILPSKIYSLETDQPITNYQFAAPNFTPDTRCKIEGSFDNYDDKGNILQYHKTEGLNINYLWAYNQTYPVAKIENATYSSISVVLNNIGSSRTDIETKSLSTDDEAQLLALFNTLRGRDEMKDAIITSYTYDPLIGIKTETNPNGKTTYYEYDAFGRLELIRDNDKNVLKHYKYNYKITVPALVFSGINGATSYAMGANVYFETNLSGGSGDFTYKWVLKKGSQIITTSDKPVNFSYNLREYGNYKIVCTVIDKKNRKVVTNAKSFVVNEQTCKIVESYRNISYANNIKTLTVIGKIQMPLDDILHLRFEKLGNTLNSFVEFTINGDEDNVYKLASHPMSYTQLAVSEIGAEIPFKIFISHWVENGQGAIIEITGLQNNSARIEPGQSSITVIKTNDN